MSIVIAVIQETIIILFFNIVFIQLAGINDTRTQLCSVNLIFHEINDRIYILCSNNPMTHISMGKVIAQKKEEF